MSIIVSNMNMPDGCQKCKFFRKYLFGNGLDYSYSCILGAKNFPMPWIIQDEKASDCPIKQLEHDNILNKIITEIKSISPKTYPFLNSTDQYVKEDDVLHIIDKYIAESEE